MVFGIWLFVWQVGYWIVGKSALVPSPLSTLLTLGQMACEKAFYMHLGATFWRVVVGMTLSFGGAILLVLPSYKYQWVKVLFEPMIAFMKSTPIMAIIILALLWFESDWVPIFVCILMCYPIIYTNLLTGLGTLDHELKELNQVYHVKKALVIRKCYWPQLYPYVAASLQLGIGMAWKVVIAAEVLAIPKYAIGEALMNAKVYIETREVFAWIVVIILISQICEHAMVLLLKKGGHYD